MNRYGFSAVCAVFLTLPARASTLVDAGLEELTPAYAERLSLVVETPKSTFGVNEPIPLTMSFKNNGAADVLISKADAVVVLEDVNGVQVRGRPFITPPPPPGYYYMMKDGKRIFTVPASLLEAGYALIETLRDAIERYREDVVPGAYSLWAHISISLHKTESVILREDTPEPVKTWVEPGSAVHIMELVSNSLEIRIEPAAPSPDPPVSIQQDAPPVEEERSVSWPAVALSAIALAVAAVGVYTLRAKIFTKPKPPSS